ncbi:iron chelate uptake ABC transporter family permease subunit [Microbacterium sp. W1N]|uniref:iron chelate uptake ABC transporter family permease subunit n=1 Tax=Microbacterium festucae TaxID=2977531 RepID=UPI0021C1B52F|nr:iron chelate uptake ABC transporter family permease subunit [Microbacterium festucae]MCT9820701.1 iron chelate uptake ABC transporter family permease subunit [Microbacterium festucae]
MAELVMPAAPPARRSGPFPTASHARRYAATIVVLTVVAALVVVGILVWDNPAPAGSDGFWRIAQLRVTSVVVILVVACCQAIATITFQTVTGNRIVTPSLMGFESLYTAISTSAIFFFGTAGALMVQGVGAYLLQIAVMLVFSGILYGWLLSGRYANVQIMLLIGIILGGALAAFSTFLQRMLTPTEFDLLTARLIGSVANADVTYLPVAVPLAAAAVAALWWGGGRLNVLALGRPVALNLGAQQQRDVILSLLMVSVLMAVCTSLIGPMTFFGFLVAMLTYQLVDSYDHRRMFAMSWLIGFVVLGGAYFVMKHIFYAAGSVGIIVEIVGGTFFLIHLLRKGRL